IPALDTSGFSRDTFLTEPVAAEAAPTVAPCCAGWQREKRRCHACLQYARVCIDDVSPLHSPMNSVTHL
ncbi:hypothetical protein, partial [Xanthomonas graminis]|uniref:hypothetical protein n=1 Tax=Xanthomonas graminis TaxID=3390026 RepID=UPI001BB0B844